MATTTPGLFSGLFRKEKFPNPELSVGLHLQETRRGDHIWDAIGPAKDNFDQLEQEINSHLIRFGESVYAEVKWTLCMIGRSKESCRPTVVFFCAEKRPRRIVKEEIKSSGILKKYPGFVTMDCNRPPGFIEVVPLGDDGGPSSLSSPKLRKPFGLANIEGAKISLQYGTTIKTATIGGVIRRKDHGEDIYYITTVAHIFPNCPTAFQDMASSSEFEYDLDSASDDDEVDDTVIETMSRGSMSSENSETEDSKSSDESTRAGSATTESHLVEPNVDAERGPGIATGLRTSTEAPSASSKRTKPKWNNEPQKTSVDGDNFEQQSSGWSWNGTQRYSVVILLNDGRQGLISLKAPPILSVDGQHPVLDYALIEVPRTQLYDFTSGYLRVGEKEMEIEQPTLAQVHREERGQSNGSPKVDMKVSGWNAMPGQLLQTPSYIRSRDRYEGLWTVCLEGKLETGHSGSWIRDSMTGMIYGHLTAGSPSSSLAYVVPLEEVLSDLRRRFGDRWSVMRRSSAERTQDAQLGVGISSMFPGALPSLNTQITDKNFEITNQETSKIKLPSRPKSPSSLTIPPVPSLGSLPAQPIRALGTRSTNSTGQSNEPSPPRSNVSRQPSHDRRPPSSGISRNSEDEDLAAAVEPLSYSFGSAGTPRTVPMTLPEDAPPSDPVLVVAAPKSSKKKVHYTASNKGKSSHSHSHRHRSNYDSGIGSSSATDREDLESLDTASSNSQGLQDQRHDPVALSEALDAANDMVKELNEEDYPLLRLLQESTRERRNLVQENIGLLKENETLKQELDQQKSALERLRREVSGGGSRRSMVPPNQPITRPPRIAPNPFAPPKNPVVYATASATYSPTPIPREGSRTSDSADTLDNEHAQQPYNDGTYHQYPV